MTDTTTTSTNVIDFPGNPGNPSEPKDSWWSLEDFSEHNLDKAHGIIQEERMPQLLNRVLLPALVGNFEDATAIVGDHFGIDWPEDAEGLRRARGYFFQMILSGGMGGNLKIILAHGYDPDPEIIDALFSYCDQIVVAIAVMEHLDTRDDLILEMILEMTLEDTEEDQTEHH